MFGSFYLSKEVKNMDNVAKCAKCGHEDNNLIRFNGAWMCFGVRDCLKDSLQIADRIKPESFKAFRECPISFEKESNVETSNK